MISHKQEALEGFFPFRYEWCAISRMAKLKASVIGTQRLAHAFYKDNIFTSSAMQSPSAIIDISFSVSRAHANTLTSAEAILHFGSRRGSELNPLHS